MVALSWRLSRPADAQLTVRPFLSGRDAHSTHHENGAFRFAPEISGEKVTWRPYEGLPEIVALSNGGYAHDPQWYRNFEYTDEPEREAEGAG